MLKKSLIITLLTISVSFCILLIPIRIGAIFPEMLALSEFELSDILFTLKTPPQPSQKIQIINCGDCNRRDVSKLIDIISEHKPKVIGIDLLFNCPDGINDTLTCPQIIDTVGVKNLSVSIRNAKNVVLVEKILQSRNESRLDRGIYDSIEYCDPMYSKYAMNGHAMLSSINDDNPYGVRISREFPPTQLVGSTVHDSFGLVIAKYCDPTSAKLFLARNKEYEIINYKGNIHSPLNNIQGVFPAYDASDILNGNFQGGGFENNVILIGYVGKWLGDYSEEDAFYSPLNKRPISRSYPDMYGIVIHANIIRMILNGEPIDKVDAFGEFAVAFVICLLQVLTLVSLKSKFERWFFLYSIGIIAAMLMLLTTSRVILFDSFDLITHFSLALVSIIISGLMINIFENLYRIHRNLN